MNNLKIKNSVQKRTITMQKNAVKEPKIICNTEKNVKIKYL